VKTVGEGVKVLRAIEQGNKMS
jgi:hypothetical protein